MNIPEEDAPPLIASDFADVSVGHVVFSLFADTVMAAAFVLLLFIIVYLNRQKYISISVPPRTYLYAFLGILAVNAAASLGAFFMAGTAITLTYKLVVATLFFFAVAALWRFVPRTIDDFERQRLHNENTELQRALAERDAAEASLRDARGSIDATVRERTSQFNQRNLALEKEVIERRLAEERAVESKRRLDELILRTNTAVVFVDAQGLVLEGNHALAQLLGRGTLEELVGRQLSRLMGLKNEETMAHFIDEALRHGTYTTDIAATPPTRGIVQIEASGAASVLNGRPCVMALLRDVTERKAAEKELLQSREALTAALEVARKANATKSDFLAKMNHELRTPLNGIIGLSEILRHKAKGDTIAVEDVRKLTDNIHQSGTHLLSLVDDLLDLSRLDTGSRSFVPTMVVVRAEIDAATITLASIADKKRISIANECDAELEWSVDQRAFKQIIINLVNNAVKFSPPGSTVRIRVRHTAESLSLQIVDEGPGITQEDRKRILMPFGRGEAAESQKADGVGLGLTIVSELLKLQGGKLTIESGDNKGSVFTAVVPVGAKVADDPLVAQP